MTANRTAMKPTTNLAMTLSDVAYVTATPPLEPTDGRNAFVGPGEKYRPAVEHWAAIVGGPVPWPNDEQRRLNPDFVEWMMGLPIGYTDVGISRSARLRCLGNMVMADQAALAWVLLNV